MKVRICFLFITLLFIPLLRAQEADPQYELLFLEKNFDAIIEQSRGMETERDAFWQVIALEQTGKLQAAIRTADSALSLFPGSAELEQRLGELYYSAGRYMAAKPILEKCREQRDGFLKYITILEFESEYDRAIELLQERVSLDSTDRDYLSRLADNYLRIDHLYHAREALLKLVSLDSTDQRSLSRLANVYLDLKKYEKSIMICNRALDIDSTNLRIHRINGFAAFRSGMFSTASASFQYILERGDSSIVTLKHLGISEIKTHAYDSAMKHLLMLFEKDPNDHEACFFLGRAYLNSPDPGPGLFFLERADSLLQPNPEVLATLYIEMVAIHTELQQFEQTVEAYEKAYALAPKPEYLFFMASQQEFNLKNKKKALELYQAFLESLPPPEAEEATAEASPSQERTGSMKEIAERKVTRLREELFFEGELTE